MSVATALTLAAALAVSAGAPAKAVRGSVQFWQRTCDAAGQCELPQAVSARLPVDGSVARPGAPGQASTYAAELAGGGLKLEFQIFWTAPADGSKPYLVAQAKLSGAAPLTECTQYAADDALVYFPVGACSGFIPAEGGGTQQLGVTFYPPASA